MWAAFGALALALALLAPAIAPLPASMDAFAGDLANGTFRPFGDAFGKKGASGFSGSLGGFTGRSEGNYLPGAQDVPSTWFMDRYGLGDNVVIDYVFNPDPGAMKRLKAFDRVGADGASLEVADKRLFTASPDPSLRYDRVVDGSFSVQLRKGEPIPIYSVHPKGHVTAFRTEPRLAERPQFLRDGADTMHILANEDRTVLLNITYLIASDYYAFDPPPGLDPSDYPAAVRPRVPANLVEEAQVVLARAGVEDPSDLSSALPALNAYFRSFTEGEIPAPSEVESLYQALALGGHGCCRHRAFAYMVTAQAIGVPTRVVVNEAHAFVEVMFPDGHWHQVNLGGCGGYTVNNPRNFPSLFEQAGDPRGEANPDEGRPIPVLATTTDITESPSRITKGERYFVNGTVRGPDGRGVAGARVDVYLNETTESPGRLTGAGVTRADGTFSVEARVPVDAPARGYQLVARSADATAGTVRYAESWSDPPVDVFTPTRFLLPRLSAAVGFPVNVTGRLVDVDGNPVPGALVRWTAEGIPRSDLRTDASGAFAGRVTFDSVGNKSVEFQYDGDDHHGPALLPARVSVENGALLLPAEAPTLLRGQGGALRGDVAAAGVALQGRQVEVRMLAGNDSARSSVVLASVTTTTDRDGAFEAFLPVPPGTAPGVYPVRYEVASLRLDATGLARVLVPVEMEVDVPDTLRRGDALLVVATLTSDNGTRVAGGIVEVTFDGNASSTRALLTNRTGVARFEIPPGALGEGAHSVRVSFPGSETHASAQATRAVDVTPPFYALVPGWVYAATVGTVLAAALLAWAFRPGGPARRLVPALAHRAPRWTLRLSFPEHPEGVPPVAEPGRPFLVRVHAHDRQGRPVALRVLLQSPTARWKGRAGDPAARMDAPERGSVALRVRARGLARWWAAPLVVAVPVLSYREAVEAGYVALRREARLHPSASTGDLLRALERRLDPVTMQRLREATDLFDAADYSETPVDRRYYHAFSEARLAVERRLRDGGGHGA